MPRTNDTMAGQGKAVEAHERNQDRPEKAKHFDLKDDASKVENPPADNADN